jgi:hypothetical protein
VQSHRCADPSATPTSNSLSHSHLCAQLLEKQAAVQAKIDEYDCWNLAPTIAIAKRALRVPPDDAVRVSNNNCCKNERIRRGTAHIAAYSSGSYICTSPLTLFCSLTSLTAGRQDAVGRREAPRGAVPAAAGAARGALPGRAHK